MAARSDSSRPTVLVVDDDEGLRTLIGEALRTEGYPVTEAASGREALRAIAENRPGLMLLDLKLKDMAGQAMLTELRRLGQPVPFIVITGQGDEKVAVKLMQSGALDYLQKDTSLLDLLPGVVHRAVASIRSEQQLAAEIGERRKLERELLEISENEQRRIGRDLHDGLGQQLTALEFMCQSTIGDLQREQPEVARKLARLGSYLRDAIAQTRTLAHSLAGFRLEANGLRTALTELAEQAGAAKNLKCRFEGSEAPGPIPDEAALHLFRIAQEAVQNAVKHSQGSKLTVSLHQTPGGLELKIADNGRGNAVAGNEGMGLRVMRYRANVIGATLSIDSAPGGGTVVCCRLPTSS